MIVLKYQDSTTEKFFENARRNLSFWGWMGGQQTFKKIGSGPNMEDSPNLYFMFFDRYEIQIQPCVLFSNGKCIIFSILIPTKNISWGSTKNMLNIQNCFENPKKKFKKKVGLPFETFEHFIF